MKDPASALNSTGVLCDVIITMQSLNVYFYSHRPFSEKITSINKPN